MAIEGRRYDVVSDKHGGATLEPATRMIVDEIPAEHGERRLTDEECQEHFGHLPSEDEG